jgi:hypothetical protein
MMPFRLHAWHRDASAFGAWWRRTTFGLKLPGSRWASGRFRVLGGLAMGAAGHQMLRRQLWWGLED